ncbi:MAG TPA: membrane protein insertase YidC [Blastocatellia bacterium]|nr:membrane protein insertase YidC [Blastocatellia bacterium]HMV83443.1 membrane protein insertase YidC [Blastocatellia bacterium]HMX24112.1 membrane protein insertase YidC [Blastocatellia bacterium]HMY70732.1 membrane protein insertase YidC [Blastocatellia bacterium]HMZ16699.1 membrane protein insertase YidC [Blastocatellia bacterium]
MEKRLVLFLLLSAVIFFGWSYVYTKLYPPPPVTQQEQAVSPSTSPTATATTAPVTQTPTEIATATTPSTQAEAKQFKIRTDHWVATLSNQGGVITEWTMTNFPDGKPIDAPTGVTLISPQLSQQIGAPFRFYIPSDSALEQTLNSVAFEIKDTPAQEVFLNKGQKKEVTFLYSGNGIEASKTLVFKGYVKDSDTGFDFDFRASVKRNGTPVDAYIVVGPNFGDHNVKEVSTYKHAPQLTYAVGSDVKRSTADDLKQFATPTASPVNWAAVDDNYFALAIAPPRAVPAFQLVKDKKVSIGVQLAQGEVNRVYAGPKDLKLLRDVSKLFDLGKTGSELENIVSYGILDYVGMRRIVQPIAQFMLMALREINKFTHNFGWSIVVLTVLLNMIFFPLRWKSSVMMKRAAAMQPKMKDIQERMKKLDKNDPRMIDLQKEQIALMKEGNPLMGCLPLLLQMPFFMAVFAILTVSIEVRHAPFFGWLTDLSTKDPLHILPIVMCITMILQTALTPSTADPMQKRVQYLMPPMLTFFFFWSAPAGLVLYWMVGNVVGVAQQFIINRLTPSNPSAPDEPTKGNLNQQPVKSKKPRQAVANS